MGSATGFGRGGSTLRHRILSPMTHEVMVSYHGTARAAKTSGGRRLALPSGPARRPTTGNGKPETLMFRDVAKFDPSRWGAGLGA